jgi:hypothetical protein
MRRPARPRAALFAIAIAIAIAIAVAVAIVRRLAHVVGKSVKAGAKNLAPAE